MSNTTIEALLIGGSHDGERIAIRNDAPRIVLPVREHEAYGSDSRFETEHYEQMRFHIATHSELVLFVHVSMTAEQAILMLADGYRKLKLMGENGREHDI